MSMEFVFSIIKKIRQMVCKKQKANNGLVINLKMQKKSPESSDNMVVETVGCLALVDFLPLCVCVSKYLF